MIKTDQLDLLQAMLFFFLSLVLSGEERETKLIYEDVLLYTFLFASFMSSL